MNIIIATSPHTVPNVIITGDTSTGDKLDELIKAFKKIVKEIND